MFIVGYGLKSNFVKLRFLAALVATHPLTFFVPRLVLIILNIVKTNDLQPHNLVLVNLS